MLSICTTHTSSAPNTVGTIQSKPFEPSHLARFIAKLPKARVAALDQAGTARPSAPKCRVFREWVELENPDEGVWAALLEEARSFVEPLPATD